MEIRCQEENHPHIDLILPEVLEKDNDVNWSHHVIVQGTNRPFVRNFC